LLGKAFRFRGRCLTQAYPAAKSGSCFHRNIGDKMLSCLIAGLISFFFTALLTISGVGATFILIAGKVVFDLLF